MGEDMHAEVEEEEHRGTPPPSHVTGKRSSPDSQEEEEEEEQDAGVHKARREDAGHGEAANDPFFEILKRAGLSAPKGGPYTAASAAMAGQQLSRMLQHSPASLDDFLKGLEDHLEDEGELRASLLPILASGGGQVQRVPQDPLIKIILGIPDVQPRLVQMLFDKMPMYMDDDKEDAKASENIPRLILAQLRWMEYTCDESEITQKLIQMIDIAHLHLQREVISALPDIVQDKDLCDVVECLENVIESNTQCINAVLDALSSFSLEPDQLFKVTEKIVSLLDSADPEDLPVMVRYLLQSTGDTILKDTVKSLRKSISFISSAEDDAGHVQFSQSATSRRGEGEVLTLEAVRSAIKFRKSIANVLIQEIASVEEAGDHMPFDVWSLVLIRSIGDAKRQAEVDRVFRSKVRSNLFQESLIRNSLVRHADALKPYFKEFRALAHQFVRANDTELSSFGTMLYTLIFKVFSDDCSRQEVLSDVMAHIGAGPCMEVDAALKVLDNLVNEDGRLLRPFAVYIKSILEYLENLATKEHVRTLFRILAKLSVGSPSAAGGDVRLDDEVHNKITKLLHATEGKFFQLGVIGAISVVIVLSAKTDESEMSAVGDHLETQATSLLSKIRSNCENNVSSSIFMFDEMADAFNIALSRGTKIKEGTRRWIDSFTEDFDQTYLPEIAEDAPVTGIHNIHKSVTVKADMNLNRPEMLVCLEVFSMIESETDKLRKMCSFFRVMSMSQMANSGNLEEIDALLGCPMYMIDNCPVEEFPLLPSNVQNDYVLSHFYASNWIVEVLNAFALVEDPDMRAKIVVRVNHLWNLLSSLNICLASLPMSLPGLNPPAFLDEPQAKGPGKGRTALGVSKAVNKHQKTKKAGKKKASKGKKKKKRGKEDEIEIEEMEEDEDEEEEVEVEVEPPATATGTQSKQLAPGRKDASRKVTHVGLLAEFVNLRDQAQSFRALNPQVYHVLHYDHELRSSHDSQDLLEPHTILSVMKDVQGKLDEVVTSCRRKACPLTASKAHKEETVPDVPGFMAMLSQVCPALVYHFKAAASQLVNDQKCSSGEDEETLAVVLGIFQRILSSADTLMSPTDDKSPVATMLHCLARECPGRSEDEAESDRVMDDKSFKSDGVLAVSFLESFSKKLPTLKLTSMLSSVMAAVAVLIDHSLVSAKCSEFAWWSLQQGKFPDAPNVPTEDVADSKDESGQLRKEAAQARREVQASAREALNSLVSTHVSLAKDPFECVEVMLSSVLQAMQPDAVDEQRKAKKKPKKGEENEEDEDEDDHEDGGGLEGFPMISSKQFVPFFNILLEFVSDRMCALDQSSFKAKDRDMTTDRMSEFITNLSENVSCFSGLVILTKTWDKPLVLSTTLKYGNRMLTSFLRIMVVLGKRLKDHRKEISDVVLSFQKATRTLQHICAHGKVEKEQRMVDFVPKVKKNLELLLFKVKGMLEANGMGQAFWLGTLKHRTIQGQQIQSQQEEEEEEEGEDQDDESISGDEKGQRDDESISGDDVQRGDEAEEETDDDDNDADGE